MMLHRAHVAALPLCLLTLTSIGIAQAPTSAARPAAVTPVSLATWDPAKPDTVRAADIRLASVTASGAPRTFQIVSIPIPDDFAKVMKLDVEMISRGDFVVLGARPTRRQQEAGRSNNWNPGERARGPSARR